MSRNKLGGSHTTIIGGRTGRKAAETALNIIGHVGTGTAHHNDRGGFFGRGIAETRVKRDALRGD